jgi:hypothetical protein
MGRHPLLQLIHLGQQAGQGVGLFRRIAPVDIQGRLELVVPTSVIPASRSTSSRETFSVLAAHVATVRKGAADQIPGVFDAPGTNQRGGIQRRP